jgi:hypothetical protein
MSLSLKISVEKNVFYPGESIPVRMLLINDSGKSKVVPAFSYNSDLTELIVSDSEGKELARCNDLRRQDLMGYFPIEVIDPPDDTLVPQDEREHEMDVSQYIRLMKAGKYQIQGSYKFYDQTFLSDPLEIEILSGTSSKLSHAWQYMLGEKWRCHLVYNEKDRIMHMAGESHNPEIICYNLPVETKIKFDRFAPAKSAFDDDEGYHLWLAGPAKNKITGLFLDGDKVLTELQPHDLKGELAEFAMVELYERRLIIPELMSENDKHYLVLHLYGGDGKHLDGKRIEVGKDVVIYDAWAYGDDEYEKYLLVYGQPVEKGFEVYSVVSEKDDLSDVKAYKLYTSERQFNDLVLPPAVDESNEIFAVSFFGPAKELWFYTISLDPAAKDQKPPKQVLKSQGELEFLNFAVDVKDLKYMLYIEDGKKLLYYNHANDEFRFVTEDKFTDPQLVVTPSDGIFLTYIDHSGLVRFRQMETVVKKH